MKFRTLMHSRCGWFSVLMTVFFTIYLGALFLLPYLFPKIHPRERQSQHYRSLSSATRTLIYGTSHVAFGIDPSGLSGPVSIFAAGGLNYELMEQVVKRTAPLATNADCVLVEIDIIPLRGDAISKFNGDFSQVYRLGVQLEDFPRSAAWKYRQRMIESPFLFPFFFTQRLVPKSFIWNKQLYRRQLTDELTKGYMASKAVISERNDGHVVVEYHRHDLRMNAWEINTRALQRMLEMLARPGRKIWLVRFPHHRTYLEAQPLEWEVQIDQLIENITRLYPDVQYFDWMNDIAFTDQDFADGHHLNYRGARKMTSRVSSMEAQSGLLK